MILLHFWTACSHSSQADLSKARSAAESSAAQVAALRAEADGLRGALHAVESRLVEYQEKDTEVCAVQQHGLFRIMYAALVQHMPQQYWRCRACSAPVSLCVYWAANVGR